MRYPKIKRLDWISVTLNLVPLHQHIMVVEKIRYCGRILKAYDLYKNERTIDLKIFQAKVIGQSTEAELANFISMAIESLPTDGPAIDYEATGIHIRTRPGLYGDMELRKIKKESERRYRRTGVF